MWGLRYWSPVVVAAVAVALLALGGCATQTTATWKRGEWKTMPLAPPQPYGWPVDPAPPSGS